MLAVKLLKMYEASVKEQVKKLFNVGDDAFEKTSPDHCVCSIAKTKDGYAGFSHRAVSEFKIGDMLFDQKWNDDGNLSEEELEKIPFKKRGGVKIKTMDQAKQSASNFAEYVS